MHGSVTSDTDANRDQVSVNGRPNMLFAMQLKEAVNQGSCALAHEVAHGHLLNKYTS